MQRENERRVVYNQSIDGYMKAPRFEGEGKLEDAGVLLEAVGENDPSPPSLAETTGSHAAAMSTLPGFGAVAACFFVSGAASLVLEVVWTRQVRLVFGSTTLAISTVLAAYMLGLGIGGLVGASVAKRLRNGVRAYGWIEIGIAAYAAVVPILIGWLPVVNYALTGALSFWPAALCRFLLALVVLLVPTILMGATLPLLVEALVRRDAEVARRVGFLYGLNTLGAVAGVFLATFFLLPRLGLFRTNLVAAVADVVIGVVALRWLAPRLASPVSSTEGTSPAPGASAVALSHPALLAYGLVGFTSLTYEVSWSRALSMILGSSIYAFASMLAAFLTGIALGSLVARRWFDGLRRPLTAYALGVALLGLFALATIVAFASLPRLFVDVVMRLGTTPLGISATHVVISMLVMLAPTLVLGALFPLLIRAVAHRAEDASAAVGRAYFANTLGSATGAFAAGFVLIPLLGLQHTLAAAVSLNLVTSAALLLWQREWRGTPRLAAATAALLAAVLVTVRPPGWSPVELTRGVFRVLGAELDVGVAPSPLLGVPPNGLLFYREGINTTVSVHRIDGDFSLRVNGKSDASTSIDMLTQVLSGEVGMLFGPKPKRVLVIGLGSAVSVGSVAIHEPDTLDVVELEPAIVEASRFFDAVNHRPLEREFVRVIADDGRNVILNAQQPYDLIISEPSNPWITGASSLFTKEFFAAARAALSPDGSLVQWAQLYAIPKDALRSILASLQSAFPYVYGFAPWSSTGDLILLARNRPLTFEDFPRWENLSPVVRNDLIRIGQFSTADLWSLLSVGPEGIREIASESKVLNSDDNLYVETLTPWALYGASAVAESNNLLQSPKHSLDELFTQAQPALGAEMLNALALAYSAQGAPRTATTNKLVDAARAAGMTADGELAALVLEDLDDAPMQRRLDAIVERYPDAFSPRLERATLRSQHGNFADALEDAEVALRARPDDPRARAARADALNGLERFQENLADARALADSAYAEYEPTVLFGGVAALAATGQVEEAIQLVHRYLERLPSDEQGWTILAELYRATGNETKQAEAEENLRLLVRNGAIGAHETALRVELSGDREGAIALLKNALEIDPSYSAAAEELKRLGGS